MPKIQVVLVEPESSLNVGMIARAMKNFDIRQLYIVNPRCEIGETARMYASHAQDIIDNIIIVDTLEELTKKFNVVVGTTGKIPKRSSIVRRYIFIDKLAKIISENSGNYLIILGREDIGLTNEELELCDLVATIDTSPSYPILNISHAAAIIFYELFKYHRKVTSRDEKILPAKEEITIFLKYIELSLILQGKSKESISRTLLKIRRLISECPFSKNDLRLMLGIIRELYEKASQQKDKSL